MSQRKPAIAIRRPPEAPHPVDVERFVSGGTPSNLQQPKHLDAQTSGTPPGPGIVKRQDGRLRRRMTVYLPPELAKALSIHCATEGLELSHVVTEAVASLLQQQT